jgi:hypothetical protein
MGCPEHGPAVVSAAEINATVTLRGLPMGFGTAYRIDEAGIEGLGVPDTKTADTSYDGRDGVFAAPDYLEVRALTIPLVLNGADAAAAFNLLADINGAWAPAEDGVDLELALTLPSWGDVILIGRPRGVEVDLAEVGDGIILALCHFDGTNPNFGAGS